ncbi:hypothetical protein, partial [Nonomuraea maheshkhaliensis]|uniref:hypothetical protein n=1 Tax=Nonomuraea maheshkhaliensis TaxID=419590 RepID=UPI0031F9B0F8
ATVVPPPWSRHRGPATVVPPPWWLPATGGRPRQGRQEVDQGARPTATASPWHLAVGNGLARTPATAQLGHPVGGEGLPWAGLSPAWVVRCGACGIASWA